MKVGELRAKGWAAIQGDVIQGTFQMRLSEVAAIAINKGINDHCEVIELAWRTPEMPYENINMPLEFKAGGYWRPYLSPQFRDYKPAVAIDEKPVFTQAMADAYIMPPVGSCFTLNYYEHDSRFNDMNGHDFEVIGINDDVYTFRSDTKGFGALRLNPINCQPIDNRTPKQKAVDAAFLAFNVDKPTLVAIYDLWAPKIEQ